MDKEMLHEILPSSEPNAYKDIYEIWLQSQKTSRARDKTPERGGRWSEGVNREKMALIRQKFMEAKRMSTDETLRQSKEFEDALEVLSSNNDLLIRLLDSQYLYELESTLLKPSKMVDDVNDKSSLGQKVEEFPIQSTRIVVLKPISGKTHGIKALVSPMTSSPKNLQSRSGSGNFGKGPEDVDVLESTKVAKEITQQMLENLGSHERDETLCSSAFSNGYASAESSFTKAYHEYTAGNFSDLELEVVSPLPRHSWDYINSCGSPPSSSSFSRAPSCFPQSSVCREAKKRLSKRWAMMASSKDPQEQRHVLSSTFGEMLSLSHIKKYVTSKVEGTNEDQEPSESVSWGRSFSEKMPTDSSPKNLPRSKSVPVSSTVYETGFRVEVCDQDAGKAHGSKELKKSRSMKSSFRDNVYSFLFSRNKKSTKEVSNLSQSKDESRYTVTETSESPVNSPGVLRDHVSQSFNSGFSEECSLPALYESSGKTSSDSFSNGQLQAIISQEPGLTVSKSTELGISSENQDQPSPISVIEPPIEKDDNAAHENLHCVEGGHLGSSHVPVKSSLIDKSPPIESVARLLSWDDSCALGANSYPLKSMNMMASLDTKVEEQHWLFFVHKLLSAAALDDQVASDSFYSRWWHSLESPLDPSLRDTYANLNDNETQPLHEAKRRQLRSYQKLVFDCVNVALMEIAGHGSEKYFMGSESHSRLPVPVGASPLLVDLIVAQMREQIGSGMRCVLGDCGDSNSLLVDNVVRKEVVGNSWAELMGLEVDILGREIEGKLIEDLVVDFTGRA